MSPDPTAGELTLALDLEGMSCSACVAGVQRALGAVPGVSHVDVDLASRTAIVRIGAGTAVDALSQAVDRAGFSVLATEVLDAPDDTPHDTVDAATHRAEARDAADREHLHAERRDLVIAAVLTAPLLVLGMSHGAIPFATTSAGQWLQLALATALLLGPGRRFFAGAWHALRRRGADMNTLVALGVGAAYTHSALAVAWPGLFPHQHHAPHLYFEAAGAILTFVLFGRMLESRARRKLSDAVRGLVSMMPRTALKVTAAGELEVPLTEVLPGDRVRVRPGERVPADGRIIEGQATLDESMMTGEGVPVDKGPGATVFGGTLNQAGALILRVTGTGKKSALGRIVSAVERARGERAPISRLADRVSSVFVPIVIGLALLTFAVWMFIPAQGADPLQVALERMITVLVIACPCALGLATPAAVAVGMGRGAELGVLFRGGAALEAASQVDTVLLDKTGTLTHGRPALTEVIALTTSEAELITHVAALERLSEHPVARAIVAGADPHGGPHPGPVEGFNNTAGAGVRGRVGGTPVAAGTATMMLDLGVDPTPLQADAERLAAMGRTPIFVAMGEPLALAGLVAVADEPRPESTDVIARLRALHIEPVMVTGDRHGTAAFIAGQLGLTRVEAEVDPTAKAAIAKQLQDAKRVVAMVGDGINDAPALATADLGVAVASGTDIAAAAADLTLARGIAGLPTALSLARSTLATIRRNLFWAFAYNVVGIPLAAGLFVPLTGWTLSPVFASLAMSLSSVSVLASSLALRRFGRGQAA